MGVYKSFAINGNEREGKVAQQVKALTAKPGDQRSVPGTHPAEGENRLQSLVP